MQNELVRHIMTAEVLSIDIRESITEAMRLFAGYPVHHIPVVDGAALRGMLSTADMLKLEYFLPKSGAQASAALLNNRFRIDKLMRSPANSATLDGTDPNGIAAAMLFLNERNALLETLRVDVARYVQAGQDERLH